MTKRDAIVARIIDAARRLQGVHCWTVGMPHDHQGRGVGNELADALDELRGLPDIGGEAPQESKPTYAVMDAARNEWWSGISKRGDPAKLTSSLGGFGDGFFAGWKAAGSDPLSLEQVAAVRKQAFLDAASLCLSGRDAAAMLRMAHGDSCEYVAESPEENKKAWPFPTGTGD